MKMIKFDNVSMEYSNGNSALNGVSLQIDDGEFVFVVGHSGAGKTTLTKLLICEERVSSGKLEVNGFNLEKIRSWKIPKLRRTMGVVFQDFKLFEKMTVYENVAFAMRVVGAKPSLIKKRVPFFLDVVGLGHKGDSFPDQLSGGEKQRVAFARALVNNPDTIIADEPTGNVDTDMTEGIMELLLKINKLGKTVIVVTHDMNIIQQYKKRVIRIENGSIVSDKIGGDFTE
ncbi:MAG: cell division ATP-binding protein FtsE [Clostridia bacterium]|nr:cell division ATP-binding protein FtsE [Clostridia bacterium]